jgi:DNA-binding GntR family transcriptional regulator
MALANLAGYRGLTATVADQLRTAIVEGELRPGQRLVQEELAQALGISREPIRQALRLLEAEGLVVHRPRRGVVVAPLAEQVVRDLYDVRAALDGLAARRAAGRLSPEQAREGQRLLASARRLLAQGNIAALQAEDRALHQLILEASGNRVAQEILRPQWDRIAAVMQAVLRSGYAQQAWAEHEALLEAILAGDADLAETLAREHAWGAADMLSDQLAASEHEGGTASSPGKGSVFPLRADAPSPPQSQNGGLSNRTSEDPDEGGERTA